VHLFRTVTKSMALALLWLLVAMLASGIVPDALCKGRQGFGLVSLVVTFVAACFGIYGYIRRLKRAENPNNLRLPK
jgi:hypothetical protein